MFVEKLDMISDPVSVLSDLNNILKITTWENNQIGIRHLDNSTNIWGDSTGSIYDKVNKKSIYKESDFRNWSVDLNCYTRQQIESLSDMYKFQVGRVRFMKLLPHHGLSVHKDMEMRYHLVLETNPQSYICENINSSNDSLEVIANSYHIPKNNHWYKVDTTKSHWVYNGGSTERIHLVVCESLK